MELVFTEIDDQQSLELNESQNKNNNSKKKQFTYDDILASLNLKVNNGKLEYIQKKPETHYDQFKTCYKKQQQNLQQQHQYNTNMKPNPYQNNYIYNKYFKDYKDPSTIGSEEAEPIHLTPEEYKRKVILELLRRQQERKRISEIKSKKLLFARPNNNNIAPVINSSPNDLNKLFRFSR